MKFSMHLKCLLFLAKYVEQKTTEKNCCFFVDNQPTLYYYIVVLSNTK
ncbi:Uncharacterised protein [Listeria fleischmannii subsp. coloradonensis]|nr:Uncharacterised protein [Listeria fleischmannii subsp. coloradonensis]